MDQLQYNNCQCVGWLICSTLVIVIHCYYLASYNNYWEMVTDVCVIWERYGKISSCMHDPSVAWATESNYAPVTNDLTFIKVIINSYLVPNGTYLLDQDSTFPPLCILTEELLCSPGCSQYSDRLSSSPKILGESMNCLLEFYSQL